MKIVIKVLKSFQKDLGLLDSMQSFITEFETTKRCDGEMTDFERLELAPCLLKAMKDAKKRITNKEFTNACAHRESCLAALNMNLKTDNSWYKNTHWKYAWRLIYFFLTRYQYSENPTHSQNIDPMYRPPAKFHLGLCLGRKGRYVFENFVAITQCGEQLYSAEQVLNTIYERFYFFGKRSVEKRVDFSADSHR